jgi:hypothetical protein
MLDFRPDAPSVNLFTADEYLVLCDWFRVDRPDFDRSVWEVLDEWNIPDEVCRFDRTDAAAAQILLERVHHRLPQWVGPNGGARSVLDRRAR